MIASITTPAATVVPDTTSVPLTTTSEANTTPVPQSSPGTTSTNATTLPATPATDTVHISSTALDMSKALQQQADQRSEIKKDTVKKQEQAKTQELKAYTAPGKNYPPFMGNGDELQKLKETSPALYREVLRMIVPPPVDLSYSDMQMLQTGRNIGTGTRSSAGG